MDNINEVLTNEEVVDTVEGLVLAKPVNGLKILATAGIVGVSCVIGVVTYKALIKPAVAKLRAKLKNKRDLKEEDDFKFQDECDDSEESD